MYKHLHKTTEIMKKQRNMTSPKECSKLLITKPKEMEIYELPNEEYRLIVFKDSQRATKHHQLI